MFLDPLNPNLESVFRFEPSESRYADFYQDEKIQKFNFSHFNYTSFLLCIRIAPKIKMTKVENF